MIHDPILSESDGWFFLSYTDVHPSWDDSLGRGSSQCQAKFATSTERFYFIEFDKLSNEVGRLESELRWLKTVKGANRNLREVRRAAKGTVDRDVPAEIETKLNDA